MKDKKVLLFDFDGTLVDSLILLKQIANSFSSKYGYKIIKDEDLEFLRGKGPREVLKFLEVPLLKIPFIAIDFKKAFQRSLTNVSLVEGIRETLEELDRKGFVLGVLTSNGKENVETYFKMQGIDFIDFVYADVHLFGKSRSIAKALKQNGLRKQDVIYIGDEIRDIEATKKIDIRIVAVSWGFNTEEVLRKALPDYIVRKPSEILNIASHA